MRVYRDITQGTEEWHRIRWGKIGGTSSSQLHTKTDTLLNRLVAQRMEEYDPTEEGFTSNAMERGHELEPFARKAASEYLNIQFNEVGWIEHDSISILGMSPDGLSEDGTVVLEIKCPGLENHIRYIREDVIPSAYMDQVIAPFAISDKIEAVYFCSYRPECSKPLFIKKVTRGTEVNVGTAARPVKMTVGLRALDKRSAALKLRDKIEKELFRISM